MTSRSTRVLAAVALVAALAVPAERAAAKGETLKHASSNVLQAPLDIPFMPYTMMDTLVRNYYMSSRYSLWEKIGLTPIMLAIYGPSCAFASSFIPAERLVEGAVLLPFGVALAGTDVDIHLYNQVHGKRGAVVDKKPFYFGARYCEGFFK